MANTLTGLIRTMYAAMNVVSRELVGFVPSVSRDASAESAAVDQIVRSPVVGAMDVVDITPQANPPANADQTIDYVDIAVTKQKKVRFHLTGEEEAALQNSGSLPPITMQRFTQGFRGIGNAVEKDLAGAYKGASRAIGTAGTTPFATADNLIDLSGARKILDDNGAPMSERTLVLNTGAGAEFRGKQSSFFHVNEAGGMEGRRMGTIGRIFGFDVRESGQLALHASGDASQAINKASGEGIGATSLVIDGGAASENYVHGDVVTIGAVTGAKYVVAAGSGVNATSVALNKPGLVAAAADNASISTPSDYTPNVAFSKDAIHLVARTPFMPQGGDSADDVINITDPHSGLVFQVTIYRQYHQVHYEIGLAWGWKVIKPEHIALILS